MPVPMRAGLIVGGAFAFCGEVVCHGIALVLTLCEGSVPSRLTPGAFRNEIIKIKCCLNSLSSERDGHFFFFVCFSCLLGGSIFCILLCSLLLLCVCAYVLWEES